MISIIESNLMNKCLQFKISIAFYCKLHNFCWLFMRQEQRMTKSCCCTQFPPLKKLCL